MAEYYGRKNYLSVWIGKCPKMDLFNEYINLKYLQEYEEDDECSRFELGKDFGIKTYDEDYSLVNYLEEETNDLNVLLYTGAPDYVTEHFINQEGQYLQEKYNCCVMFYDMDYTGERKEVLNEQFGKFVFLGSLVSDKFDML